MPRQQKPSRRKQKGPVEDLPEDINHQRHQLSLMRRFIQDLHGEQSETVIKEILKQRSEGQPIYILNRARLQQHYGEKLVKQE